MSLVHYLALVSKLTMSLLFSFNRPFIWWNHHFNLKKYITSKYSQWIHRFKAKKHLKVNRTRFQKLIRWKHFKYFTIWEKESESWSFSSINNESRTRCFSVPENSNYRYWVCLKNITLCNWRFSVFFYPFFWFS